MLTLLAQLEDSFEVSPIPDAASAAATGGILAFLAGLGIFLLIIGAISFVLWLWALIDAARRQFQNPNDKVMWLLLIIIGGFIVGPIPAIIYLIVGRKKGTIRG